MAHDFGYPDTINKKQSGISSPLRCFTPQDTDPDEPCYFPKKEKVPAKKESNKRPRVKSIGEKNFKSEKRLPGFAEDITKTEIQKDAYWRNKKTLNPKPKAKVFKKKK